MDFRWDILVEYAPFFLKGTLLTIGLSIASYFNWYHSWIVNRIRENNEK